MKDKYDVIIIGAGIGGLVCGCYLAKAGFKVLIIEKNKNTGGCASSIRINGFTYDMGAHLIGGCDNSGLFSHYLRKLGINIEFIRLSPFDRFNFINKGNYKIDVPSDLNSYIEYLEKLYPAESSNIKAFFKKILEIYRAFILNKEDLLKYKNMYFQNILNAYINNKELKGILSAQCLYIGLPPEKASVIGMSFTMISYLRDGMYYTKGGTQVLADSLCKNFLSNHGDIIFQSEVISIVVENKKVQGVKINTHEFIRSKAVISNADADKTFTSMIGVSNLEKSFVKKLRSMKKGVSFFVMHTALDLPIDEIQNITGWHYDSYDINNCYKKAVYIFSPSVADNLSAPKGKSIIHILKMSTNKFGSVADWKKLQQEVKASLLKRVEKLLKKDIRKYIIHEMISSPKDIENYTGNSDGAIYGWEMSPKYMLSGRLENRTPIKGLFLTGHWTNPGCGVLGVASSGFRTYSEVMKDFK